MNLAGLVSTEVKGKVRQRIRLMSSQRKETFKDNGVIKISNAVGRVSGQPRSIVPGVEKAISVGR